MKNSILSPFFSTLLLLCLLHIIVPCHAEHIEPLHFPYESHQLQGGSLDFGTSVSANEEGTWLAVGAPQANRVRVFLSTITSPNGQTRLWNATSGRVVESVNTSCVRNFGQHIAMSGNRLSVSCLDASGMWRVNFFVINDYSNPALTGSVSSSCPSTVDFAIGSSRTYVAVPTCSDHSLAAITIYNHFVEVLGILKSFVISQIPPPCQIQMSNDVMYLSSRNTIYTATLPRGHLRAHYEDFSRDALASCMPIHYDPTYATLTHLHERFVEQLEYTSRLDNYYNVDMAQITGVAAVPNFIVVGSDDHFAAEIISTSYRKVIGRTPHLNTTTTTNNNDGGKSHRHISLAASGSQIFVGLTGYGNGTVVILDLEHHKIFKFTPAQTSDTTATAAATTEAASTLAASTLATATMLAASTAATSAAATTAAASTLAETTATAAMQAASTATASDAATTAAASTLAETTATAAMLAASTASEAAAATTAAASTLAETTATAAMLAASTASDAATTSAAATAAASTLAETTATAAMLAASTASEAATATTAAASTLAETTATAAMLAASTASDAATTAAATTLAAAEAASTFATATAAAAATTSDTTVPVSSVTSLNTLPNTSSDDDVSTVSATASSTTTSAASSNPSSSTSSSSNPSSSSPSQSSSKPSSAPSSSSQSSSTPSSSSQSSSSTPSSSQSTSTSSTAYAAPCSSNIDSALGSGTCNAGVWTVTNNAQNSGQLILGSADTVKINGALTLQDTSELVVYFDSSNRNAFLEADSANLAGGLTVLLTSPPPAELTFPILSIDNTAAIMRRVMGIKMSTGNITGSFSKVTVTKQYSPTKCERTKSNSRVTSAAVLMDIQTSKCSKKSNTVVIAVVVTIIGAVIIIGIIVLIIMLYLKNRGKAVSLWTTQQSVDIRENL